MHAPEPYPLSCTGADHVTRRFWYTVEQHAVRGAEEVHVRVHPRNPPEDALDRWFELVLRQSGLASYRILSIDRNRCEYGGKGIPDALLPELCRRFGIEIWSSTLWNEDDPSDSRTYASDAMWERLVRKGLASHSAEVDRYRCPPT